MARQRQITTQERAISRTKTEIIKEAGRLEESTLFSAKRHFVQGSIWGVCHVCLGLPTTVLSAIIAVSAFSDFDPTLFWTKVFSITIAGLSALMTFMNPNKKSETHHKAGNDYDALNNRVRIFRTIDCWSHESEASLTAKLTALTEEKNTLNANSPQTSWLAYLWAKRGIEEGEAAFQVDNEA